MDKDVKKNAIMYGAGNIGRGFIGMLFSRSGYHVTFIDVSKPLVNALHERGSYPVRIMDAGRREDILIEDVDSVDGTNADAVARAIADADVMATAVGAKILSLIVPHIAAGLKLRHVKGGKPLNILICENMIDANNALGGWIRDCLDNSEKEWFNKHVGLVSTSIGRMVPVQTLDMQDGDPLRVCVERYGFLPVDRDAFRGELPQIHNMVPFSPFDYYIRRKLYIHNMGHAVIAYLGLYGQDTVIADAIDDAEIYIITFNAMVESAEALSRKYDVPLSSILRYVQDLLIRFSNRSLGDTCARVGADVIRKLSACDRLIGAARFCLEQGVTPVYLCVGAAGALYEYLKNNDQEQSQANAENALVTLSGSTDKDLCRLILRYYVRLACNDTIANIRRTAQIVKGELNNEVV